MSRMLLILGLVAGTLAGLLSVVYATYYQATVGVDWSATITVPAILIASLIGCLLASLGYGLLNRWLPRVANLVANVVFLGVTILAVLLPFSMPAAPVSHAHLLSGLTTPMHVFPFLFWVALKPIFVR